MADFFPQEYTSFSEKREFGICDHPDPAKEKAYISENSADDWIAVVNNVNSTGINFVPVDHCIALYRQDGIMDKRCDGFLYYSQTIIFVELKQRRAKKRIQWIKDGVEQLKTTISHFKREPRSKNFMVKHAYIANKKSPDFKSSQQLRMDRFKDETGYTLFIKGTIDIQ